MWHALAWAWILGDRVGARHKCSLIFESLSVGHFGNFRPRQLLSRNLETMSANDKGLKFWNWDGFQCGPNSWIFLSFGPHMNFKTQLWGNFFFWIFRDGCGPLGSLHPPIIFQFWMRKSDKSWTCVGVLPNFEIILLRYYYDVTIYWFSSTRFDSVQLIIIAKPIIWKTCLSLLFTKKTHTHTQFKEPVQTIWITVLKFGSVRLIFFRKPLMDISRPLSVARHLGRHIRRWRSRRGGRGKAVRQVTPIFSRGGMISSSISLKREILIS